MNLRLDLQVLGWLLIVLGFFELLPAPVALYFGEPMGPFLVCGGITLVSGILTTASTQTDDTRLRPRDAFLIVGSAWFVASIVGALPYVATGTLAPIDGFFESASGFTTTGSTVIVDIDATSHSVLFWRSFTQWVGGMGIILFTIAILPLLGIGGMSLFRAEVPGPIASKVSPRVADTARKLWSIYVGLTAAELLLLRLAGLDWFDALNHALTTMATGGFSTHAASIGGYQSALVEWIVIAFMLLAGTNFVLHYKIITGRGAQVFRDHELRYYLLVIALTSVAVWASLPSALGIEAPFRTAVFQVVSLITTTGYASADFEIWPGTAQAILLFLMFSGGMAGSTSGGVKSLRSLLALRSLHATLDRLVHPHALRPVKFEGAPVDDGVLADMWAFFAAFLIITLATTLLVASAGYDLDTSLSAALTSIGNVGPGLGSVGPYDHFGHIPTIPKMALAICMIAGRLEIFTLLVLFLPAFWRR